MPISNDERRGVPAYRRFACDRKGATAVEFAMVLAPFIGLLAIVFQLGLAFLIRENLHAAVEEAARQVMTGQILSNGTVSNATTFRDQTICTEGILGMVPCKAVVLDVRPASSFTSLGNGNVNASFMTDGSGSQYNAGLPCQVMVVRVAYPMPNYLPLISWGAGFQLVSAATGLTNYNGNLVYMLSAAAVFRNEPYTNANGSTMCAS